MTCNLCGEHHFSLVNPGNMDAADLTNFSQYMCYGNIYRCDGCGLHLQHPEHENDELITMIKRDTYSDERMDRFVLADKRQQFEGGPSSHAKLDIIRRQIIPGCWRQYGTVPRIGSSPRPRNQGH